MRITMSFCAAGLVTLSGCGEATGSNPTIDGAMFDRGAVLSDMAAGIWVDPMGCDHWIVDDGVEGYMTPRVHRDGRPVCRADAVPNTSNVIRTFAGSRGTPAE